MAITVKLPKDGEGSVAEVKVGEDFHVVLKAVQTAVGPVTNVYDAKRERWDHPRYAGSLEEAKAQAEMIARSLHKHGGHKGEFPHTLEWQTTA